MNQAPRAALLSGLVYPGLGQANNGQRKKAFIIAAVISVQLIILAYSIYRITADAMGFPADIRMNAEIYAEIHRQAYGSNLFFAAGIVAVWLYSIIDAWWVGRRLEQE